MSGDLNSDFSFNGAHPTTIKLLQYPPSGEDSGILITFSSILIYIPVLSLRLVDKDY